MNKPRTIITTDLEVDDMNSMIHLCLYLNEMNLLGAVYTSSQFHFEGDGIHTLGEVTPHYRTSGNAGLERPRKSHGPDPEGKNLKSFRPFPMGWIENLWKNEYTQAYPYLLQHDSSYPSPEYLLSVTKYGNIEFEGDVRSDTEGSDLIKQYLLDNDSSPLYLQSWGGVNTIVRALLAIYETYHDTDEWESVYAKVCGKARILGVNNGVGQDNSFLDHHIPELYPDLQCVSPEHYYGVYMASERSQNDIRDMFKAKWMLANIHNGTSALMDAYRLYGDGKRVEGEAEVYQYGFTTKLDFGIPGFPVFDFEPYDFIGEGDSNTYIPLITFGLRGMENPAYGTLLGKLVQERRNEPAYSWLSGKKEDVNPYIKAYQEDWAARAEWCSCDYAHANHAPVITLEKYDADAVPGEVIPLNAEVTDPDGDEVAIYWEADPAFSNYQGEALLRVWEPWKKKTFFTVPQDAKDGDWFALILRAEDRAEKPMTRFAEMIVHVKK